MMWQFHHSSTRLQKEQKKTKEPCGPALSEHLHGLVITEASGLEEVQKRAV